MTWVCVALSAALSSAAPLASQAVAQSDSHAWLAQAEQDKPEGTEGEQPPAPTVPGQPPPQGKMPRPMPLGGARRLLGREGLRAMDRRAGISEPERAEDATAVTPGSAAPAGATPVAATPSAAGAASPGATGTPQGGAHGAAAASAVDPEARPQNQKYNFEFSKANIMDVVKLISNITRRNFIVPDAIKSQTITILSPTKISANEAWQVFLSALETNNITIVKVGKFYKLVNSKESLKTTIPTCIGPDDECPQFTEQMVTLILRLNHVDGNQLQSVIKSLGGKDGDVTLFAPSNALIISDYAPNIQRIKRIIEALDVPGFQDELQIVQVQYATATEIATKLTEVFEVNRAPGAARATGAGRARVGKEGAPAVPPGAPGAAPAGGEGDEGDVQISKIIPDDRTNQIIIKANRQSFDSIKRLVAKLDIPVSDAEQGRVHVHYLENASAEELASTLSSLAQGPANRPGARGATATPTPAGQNPPPRVGAESATLFEGEIKITADKATNSLLVMSSGRDFRSLKRIIEQLDIPRRQVYVEAAIMEVTVDDSLNFGTNWHAPMRFGQNDLPGGMGGPGSIGFVQNPGNGSISPTLAPLTNPASLLGIANGSIVGLVGKALTIPVGDNSITLPSFGIVLRALQSASNAQVLSTPHILTTDNEEASIEVGQKIPFRRGTSLPTGGGLSGLAGAAGGDAGNALSQLSNFGNLFSSTDRIDVSLKLKLTPQINESDRIRLEIDQQIEDLAGIDEVTGQPKTSTRAAKTVVVVEDQQTVVIGGLMRDIRSDSESKIPLLGDIPIIGWLFKQRTRTTQKVNLVLVLTPYIVRNSDDFQIILERKVKEYEEFASEFYSNRPEYRAYVDYRRKNGPFARLAQAVVRARARAENGGAGDGKETVVAPVSESPDALPVGQDDEETIPVPTDPAKPPPPSSGAPPPVIAPPVEATPVD